MLSLSFQVRRAYQRRKEKQSLTKSLGYANDQSLTVSAALLMKSLGDCMNAPRPASRLHERNQQTVSFPVRAESPKSHVSLCRGTVHDYLIRLSLFLFFQDGRRPPRSTFKLSTFDKASQHLEKVKRE